MRTTVGGVQPAVGFGNWPRQIRLASDLTESGTKLRSRVLHLKVAVVELPVKVVHEGGCGRETQDRRRKCVRNSACFASLCASPDPVVKCPDTGHSPRVSPNFAPMRSAT